MHTTPAENRRCGQCVISQTPVEYLRDLVTALDNSFISSWQSTAGWSAQLENARRYLAELDQEQSYSLLKINLYVE